MQNCVHQKLPKASPEESMQAQEEMPAQTGRALSTRSQLPMQTGQQWLIVSQKSENCSKIGVPLTTSNLKLSDTVTPKSYIFRYQGVDVRRYPGKSAPRSHDQRILFRNTTIVPRYDHLKSQIIQNCAAIGHGLTIVDATF